MTTSKLQSRGKEFGALVVLKPIFNLYGVGDGIFYTNQTTTKFKIVSNGFDIDTNDISFNSTLLSINSLTLDSNVSNIRTYSLTVEASTGGSESSIIEVTTPENSIFNETFNWKYYNVLPTFNNFTFVSPIMMVIIRANRILLLIASNNLTGGNLVKIDNSAISSSPAVLC